MTPDDVGRERGGSGREDLPRTIVGLFDSWRLTNAARLSQYDTYEKFYRAKHPNEENKPFVNEFFPVAEMLTSEIDRLIFSADPFFAVVSRGSREKSDEAGVVFALLRNILKEIKFRDTMLDFTRKYLTFGKGVLYAGVSDKASSAGMLDCRAIDPRNLAYDFLRGVRESDWCIEKTMVSEFELEDMEDGGNYRMIGSVLKDFRAGRITSAGDAASESQDVKSPESGAKMPLYRFYGSLRLPSGGVMRGMMVHVVGGKVILERKLSDVFKDGEKPFFGARAPALSEGSEGVGLGDISEYDIMKVDELVSMQVRLIRMALKNMWLDANSGLANKKINAEEGLILKVKEAAALRPITPLLEAIPYSNQVMSYLLDNYRRNSGGALIMQGVPGKGTLGQDVIAKGQSSGRIYQGAKTIAENVVAPALATAWDNAVRRMPDDLIYKMLGERAMSSAQSPKNITSKFDFSVNVSPSMVSPEETQHNHLMLFDMGIKANNSPDSSRKVDLSKIIDASARTLMPDSPDMFIEPENDYPDTENLLLDAGVNVPVFKNQNHSRHLQSHIAHIAVKAKTLELKAEEAHTLHINSHVDAAQTGAPPASAPGESIIPLPSSGQTGSVLAAGALPGVPGISRPGPSAGAAVAQVPVVAETQEVRQA